MLNINTNLSSLIAQNSLNQSTNKLNTAIERMSTGCKINHAKDNAANYSISTNMTTKIGAYQVAEDNLAMGLDMLATLNGTVDQISDKLSRLRALAEQSANGTYGAQSKQAINQEANAIIDEINRLYNSSEYNGVDLLKIEDYNLLENENAPKATNSGFITAVSHRDTTGLTSLSDVVDKTVDLQDGEYAINSEEDLELLATMTYNGLISSGDKFVLGRNLDLSSYANWSPIGAQGGYAFKGQFDGNGYTISNVKVNTVKAAGLFGNVQSGASVKNLAVKNAYIQGERNLGILAGYCDNSTIENCYTTGQVKALLDTEFFSAGFIGQVSVNSTIIDCYSTADVEGKLATGGFIGQVTGSGVVLKSCYATGDVSGIQDVGGFTGAFGIPPEIDNCYATGNVKGEKYVGGFVGFAQDNTDITNCYATGNIKGEKYVGGFIGGGDYNKIVNCYSEGSVVGNYQVGGLIGSVLGVELDNCYTTSYVSAPDQCGGFFGYVGDGNIVKNSIMLATGDLQGVFTGKFSTSTSYTTTLTVDNVKYSSSYQDKLPFIAGSFDASALTTSNLDVIVTEKTTVLQVGVESSDSSRIELKTSVSLNAVKGLSGIGLDDSDGYLEDIDNLLSDLNSWQVEIGSVSNRLESMLEEVGIQYDNLVSSRSTLRDADIAEVSAEYIQQQILQQASATLLATANQSPSIALQLI